MRVVLASSNAGKLRELSTLLAPLGLDLIRQSELGVETPEETGNTFTANALLKARHAAGVTGLPALADDSGIEVDALGGRPGIYSARYAGPAATDQQNLDKMLAEMHGIPEERRGARYQCVIVLLASVTDPQPLVAAGTWEGRLLTAPRGSKGFGYDPIFVPSGRECTAAELDPAEKNALSHRGQALSTLLTALQARRG